MRAETQRWLGKADGDLLHAEHALRDGDVDWASFASPQVVEKALKALLMERTGELIVGHNLSQLADRAQVPEPLAGRCSALAPAYIGTRYADAPTYPRRSRAPGDVALAKEVVAWVKSQLSSGRS